MLLLDPGPLMTEVRLPVPRGEYEMVYELPLAATLVVTTALAEAVMMPAKAKNSAVEKSIMNDDVREC